MVMFTKVRHSNSLMQSLSLGSVCLDALGITMTPTAFANPLHKALQTYYLCLHKIALGITCVIYRAI